MNDPEENQRRENFLRQVAEFNAYHQKKLKSPDEVSKRLNYQDKTKGDPNNPFKGPGRRVGFSPQPAMSSPPRSSQYQYMKPQNRKPPSNSNAKPKRIDSFQQQPNSPQYQKPTPIHHNVEIKKPQFNGIGQVVGSIKPKRNQMNEILPPQSSSYCNQQGVEMRTWHNILNDPMDEQQTEILSLINQIRARNNKPPLAFSRSCTAQVHSQIEKVVRNEIELGSFHDGIQERAEKIPRCKKANEVFASVSKIFKKAEPNVKPTANIRPSLSVKYTSTIKHNPALNSKPSNLNSKRTQTKEYDPIKAIFDKWMEKSTMRTTILGNYQVIGISFSDINDGSSLVGAAILAQIS